MTFTVRQLAEWVREKSSATATCLSRTPARSPSAPGDITFVDTTGTSRRGITAAVGRDRPETVAVNGRPVIRVSDPLMAFARVVQQLRARPAEPGPAISPAAMFTQPRGSART